MNIPKVLIVVAITFLVLLIFSLICDRLAELVITKVRSNSGGKR